MTERQESADIASSFNPGVGSLANAHGLEEVFWEQDADGKWGKKCVDQSVVKDLVAERTSPTAKAALESLLAAPAAVGGGTGKGKRKTKSAKL